MKIWLLVWNLVLTVLIIALVVGACSSSTSDVANLRSQVDANKVAIAQLQATVAQQAQQIQTQAA